MSTKHTPGPWINDGDTVSARPDPENSQTYIAPICVMDDEWGAGIAAANAALIAAAPDLLAALREIVDWHGHEISDPALVELAQAAIAKATASE